MPLDDDSSTAAIVTLGDVGIRMRSRAMTVSADYFARYLKLL